MQTTSDVYTVPQEHLDFRDTIRQIVTERVGPRAGRDRREGRVPVGHPQALREQDLLGLPFDEEFGGTGTGTLMLQMAVEEVARACASSALILMVQELGTLPIQLFGSDELKARFLPALRVGRVVAGVLPVRARGRLGPGSMRTTAVRDGDEWVINGTKNWITNAGIADFYVVFAQTDRENRRISAFVVEKDRPGLSIGKLEHKLGIKGSPTGSPVFEDVRVPHENLIGQEGKGLGVALGTLERTRLGAAAQAVGIAQGATDYASHYAKERITFGKPIGQHQAIGHKLADMETGTAAARELLYKACAMADRVGPPPWPSTRRWPSCSRRTTRCG
jgi:alkylation response protein AidB-like acyl-CoA dehydrogenase